MKWPEHIGKVICGDAIETMKGIPAGVVQCCITSPPYWGLRDYSLEPTVWGGDNGCRHEWGNEIESNPSKYREKRILHADWKTGGEPKAEYSKTQGQFCSLCSAWRGNLGLEPTPELYVEHLVEVFREVRRILRDDGTLWLNLGDSYVGSGKASGRCWEDDNIPNMSHKQASNVGSLVSRMPDPPGLKPKDLVMIPARVALALQADGWWLRSVIIWHKPSCMPESVTDRPTTAHEYVYLLAKSESYYYDADAIREPYTEPLDRWGGEKLRADGVSEWDKGTGQTAYRNRDMRPNPSGRNKRTVWTINPEPTPYAHFATFPQKLVEPPIMAGSKVGDIVLDPFSGSGTVGVVAKKLQRKYILIDLNAEYNKIAEDRLRQRELF